MGFFHGLKFVLFLSLVNIGTLGISVDTSLHVILAQAGL